MEIVIDLPKNWEKCNIRFIKERIRNGTPLPKGHGALKDAGMIKRFLYSSARFWGTWNLGKRRIFEAIDNVGAAIEAYNEVDE